MSVAWLFPPLPFCSLAASPSTLQGKLPFCLGSEYQAAIHRATQAAGAGCTPERLLLLLTTDHGAALPGSPLSRRSLLCVSSFSAALFRCTSLPPPHTSRRKTRFLGLGWNSRALVGPELGLAVAAWICCGPLLLAASCRCPWAPL